MLIRNTWSIGRQQLTRCLWQIWARARSTVGTGAESKVYGRNIPITISGLQISPVSGDCVTTLRTTSTNLMQGDIILCDPLEGVVHIPASQLDEVLDLMPKLVEADDKVKAAVAEGMSVAEAFKKFRG